MSKKSIFGISYVSLWVLIWGTLGSIIDLPFLNSKIYLAGSVGQLTTFSLTGFVSVLLGVWLYPKVLKSGFLVAALGLDVEDDQ